MQKTTQIRAETEERCAAARDQCAVMAEKNLMIKNFVGKLNDGNSGLGYHSGTEMS